MDIRKARRIADDVGTGTIAAVADLQAAFDRLHDPLLVNDPTARVQRNLLWQSGLVNIEDLSY